MKNLFHLLAIVLFFSACNNPESTPSLLVTNEAELREAIANATPGDKITLANGGWKDIEIRFQAEGTEEQPITLQAEEAGQVFIEGKSDLKLGGNT